MSDLEAKYFKEGLPKDPFSGKDFNYRVVTATPDHADSGTSRTYTLWSVGPDVTNDNADVIYNVNSPRYKGWKGDVVFPESYTDRRWLE